MLVLIYAIDFLLKVATYVIIIQAVLSWLLAFNVINTSNDFVRSFLMALDRMTAPIYRPIRAILPDFGGIDFSPIVVILIIQLLRAVVLPAIAMRVVAG